MEENASGIVYEDENNEPEADGSMSASSIQVGGLRIEGDFLVDAKGNRWAVPNDDTMDFDDLYADDVYKDAIESSPQLQGFHVQMIRDEQLGFYRQRGFVPVDNDELPISTVIKREYGSPVDTRHRYSGAMLVKIPNVYREAWERREEERARERVAAMQPTQEVVQGGTADMPITGTVKRSFTLTESKPFSDPKE